MPQAEALEQAALRVDALKHARKNGMSSAM